MNKIENWIKAIIENGNKNGNVSLYGTQNNKSLGSIMKQLQIPIMEIPIDNRTLQQEKIQIPIQPL